MLEKLQVFSLNSNNPFIGKGSYRAERKHKTIPDNVNVCVTKTSNEFSKRFKLERNMKANENLKGQKPKRKTECKKAKLKRLKAIGQENESQANKNSRLLCEEKKSREKHKIALLRLQNTRN